MTFLNFVKKIVKLTSVSLKFEPHIKEYLTISLGRSIVQAPCIPQFEGLGIRTLQYLVRICHKSHKTVPNHN